MPEPETISQSALPAGKVPARSRSSSYGLFVDLLGRLPTSICATFERRPWLLFALLMLIYLPAAEYDSMKKPLWHDELFTWHLAQFPTLADTWTYVKIMDLNPPLLYVLTRWSYAALGVSTLATRLPEMLFYLLALGAIFDFVRRRMGAMFGGFTVAIMLLGGTLEFAYEARPYALLLGSLGLTLTAWSLAVESSGWRRAPGCLLVLVSASCMMLSHIFAVGAMAALIAAELWRERRQRRADLPVLAALLLPLGWFAFDLPILRGHGAAIFPDAFVPTLESTTKFYVQSLYHPLFAVIASALAVLLLGGPAHVRLPKRAARPEWFLTSAEWVALALLALVPLVLQLDLMHAHGAFFPRYGIMCAPAFAVGATALFCRWTSTAGSMPDARAALIGMVVTLLMSNQTYRGLLALASGQLLRSPAHSEPQLRPCQSCAITSSATAARDSTGNLLPLVNASGLTFVEMNQRESAATLRRVYYLTDPEASTRIAHANIFERMPEVVANFHLAGHTEPYARFISAHPHFYVLGRNGWPEDWLIPRLIEDGATMRTVARTKDDYVTKDLWEVTLPAQPALKPEVFDTP